MVVKFVKEWIQVQLSYKFSLNAITLQIHYNPATYHPFQATQPWDYQTCWKQVEVQLEETNVYNRAV